MGAFNALLAVNVPKVKKILRLEIVSRVLSITT